jgi:hypothetical protein
MTKLAVAYDNSEPRLVAYSPLNGQLVKGRVHVEGVAPVGAKVWLNDLPLRLDALHRFDTFAAPIGAPPVLVFRCRVRGRDATTVRVLKSEP